jgi:lipopolysaccharide/colanic/teichoic acid biosynthesis glycosyltransferase
MLDLDVSYIANWTIWGDLALIARTFVVLLAGRGAY